MLDGALLVAGWGIVLHIFLNYEYYTNRIIYIDELTFWDKFWAVVAMLIVLEGTRRSSAGRCRSPRSPSSPTPRSSRTCFPVLMEQVYLSTEGIFGSTLGVSASYVMMFVLFGVHGEERHRAAVHGLLDVHHRPLPPVGPARYRW